MADQDADLRWIYGDTPGRTDPWRWYCRMCGESREYDTAHEAGAAANDHIANGQPCGQGNVKSYAIAGRLLHIWTYTAL